MNSDLEGVSLSVPSFGHPPGAMAENSRESSAAVNSATVTLWHDPSCKSANPGLICCPSDAGTLLSTCKNKTRAVTVVYVRNTEMSQSQSPENMALQCLKDACDILGCKLEIVHFGMLDFGETSVLDHFYNAGEYTDVGFVLYEG